MSQSTLPTTQRADDKQTSRFAQGERREGRWFWLSLLLHGVGIVALVVFTPVGDVLLAKSQPRQADLMLTQERAQELADQIRELSAEDLQQRVESLEMVDQQMEELRVEQRSKLTEEQVEADAEAPAKAMEQMVAAVEEMGKTAEAMAGEQTHDAVNEAMKQVSDTQDKANEALMGAGMEYDQVRRAQKQAIVEQLEVKGWQQQIEQKERDVETLSRQVERAAGDVERIGKAAEATKNRLEDTQNHLVTTQEKQAKAAAELKATVEKLASEKQGDANGAKQRATLERRRDMQTQDVKRLETTAAQDAAAVKKLGEQLKSHQQQLAERETRLADLKKQKQEAEQEQKHAVEQRLAQQQEAKKTQEKAIESLKQAMAKANTPGDQKQQAVVAADAGKERVTTKDPVKLYQQAKMLEEKITDSYREFRAAELAKIQNMKLAEAMSRVDVPEPVREPVDKQVLGAEVKTAERLQDYKKELAKVDQHMQSMQMSADAMLSAARQVSHGFADELTTAMTIERQQQLDELALENTGEVAADLTALMKGELPADGQGAELTQGQGEGKDGQDGKQGGVVGGKGAGASARGAGRGYPEVPKNVKALAGRSVGVGGVKSDWMYLDSWWMVGPFGNPDRKNIHQKFAPETVVDLDAVYVGDGGRPIRWQFVQSNRAFIMPPGKTSFEYSIWYAYTEVRFDKATDMWIAVGSDDRSDIWINGQKVWSSSDVLKSWRVDEGYRKVHFQQGVNRVLYRIENGWHSMGFSMLLHTAPTGDSPTPIQYVAPAKAGESR